MNARPVLDVSTLPVGALGPRAPLWWGTMTMIAIESTVFALLIASYFYLRMRYSDWPPPTAGAPDLLLPTINVAVLIASGIPQYKIDEATESQDQGRLRRLLIIGSLLGAAACVLRVWDFKALNITWDANSYGSITWALLFAHSIHLAASTCETILMAVYVSEVPLDEKHRLDLNVNAIYWFFIVIAWVVIYAVIWWGGRVL
jgi:heme/copper-type cytochrome/quinol oxidase subunit 3